jgi:hypothetical protein
VGTLIVPCWQSASFWPMLCPGGDGFIDQVKGYIFYLQAISAMPINCKGINASGIHIPKSGIKYNQLIIVIRGEPINPTVVLYSLMKCFVNMHSYLWLTDKQDK